MAHMTDEEFRLIGTMADLSDLALAISEQASAVSHLMDKGDTQRRSFHALQRAHKALGEALTEVNADFALASDLWSEYSKKQGGY